MTHSTTSNPAAGDPAGDFSLFRHAGAQAGTVRPAPARILVVDDEPEIAASLTEFLSRREGYRIQTAGNGREAVRYLQSTVGTPNEVDLVLLDMRMPGMSGLDVLDWIRSHPDLRYTRVVLLTAAAGSHEKVEALSAGADDYITKPYYMQELLARVQTILRTQQLEKQLQRQSQQLAALNRIGQTVAASLDANEVQAAAASGIHEVLDVELAAVHVLESGRLRCRHVRTRGEALPPESFARVEKGHGLLGMVFESQTAVYVNDVAHDSTFLPGSDVPARVSAHSAIVTPLLVRGQFVGTLSAFNKITGAFSEFDQDLFASLASSISEAIENAWLFQRIRLRQQQILESRNTLQALIDGIPDPIYTINDDWKLVAVNHTKADALDATSETLSGQICYQAFFERDTPCEHCMVAETLAGQGSRTWSVRWFGDDHLPQEWEINAYPIPSQQASSARAVIVWRDRTEERRLENSLMQAGKLAAIGQLAAGVAHEINNPLTAVNANAQMLKMVIPPEDENYEAVELIAIAGERATRVVRGLLDFARQEHYAFVPGSVNESIEQALELIRYQLQSAHIEIQRQMQPDLPAVVASWEHLKSVWLNLILNARDALLDVAAERRLSLTTRLVEEAGQVQILVHDNGKGISAAESAHIFEPFYTTKDPGKGTGLGLATCHRIIEQHQGEINVVSAPGEGTTFIVRLPVRQPVDNGKRPS